MSKVIDLGKYRKRKKKSTFLKLVDWAKDVLETSEKTLKESNDKIKDDGKPSQ